MILNGKIFNLSDEINIFDFLKSQNYSIDRVAVELNGSIIPKAKFKDTVLKDNDKIEVVNFVGGG